MSPLNSLLNGRKTYLVAAVMVAYQFLDFFLHGAPIDANKIMEALGLATLRAGIAKRLW